MKSFIPGFFFLFLSVVSSAATIKMPTAEEYQAGKVLCSKGLAHEKGFYTTVPVDYQNPAAGESDVYGWFQNGYSAAKPTLVYLTGGPGLGVHWRTPLIQEGESAEFNLLLVDPRGAACSRPRSYKEYLTPEFYSSENVAMDLEEIRKKLNIEKWSVLGVSYGTMPATIYGSMFPEHTRSILLEGVTYDTETLWTHKRRKAILNEIFEAQSDVVQERIKTIEKTGVEASWFFIWAKSELLYNKGYKSLSNNLARLSKLSDYEAFVAFLKNEYDPSNVGPRDERFVMNHVPYHMIACQEMGVLDYEGYLGWSASGEIVGVNNPSIVENCNKVHASSKIPYSALRYPLNVPTFYFQGGNDSATEPEGALSHFHNVARSSKQFFLMENGGHNPSQELLMSGKDDPIRVLQKEIVLNAINGVLSNNDLIEKINPLLGEFKWKVLIK
jgi:proline iminopeptidase